MGKTSNTPRSFWLTILAFTIIVNLAMLRLTYLHLIELKADLLRSTWSGMLVLCFVIMAIWATKCRSFWCCAETPAGAVTAAIGSTLLRPSAASNPVQ
jgi:hypothetical protein